MFHRGEPLTETVWEKLMLGLSTRKYGQAVREFTEAYGLEKSAVSEHFIEASRAKLQEMMERRLEKTRLLRAAHRRHTVRRAATGSSNGNQPGRAENDFRPAARRH
jgi:hypothetical protein